jgi:hypothetical protein
MKLIKDKYDYDGALARLTQVCAEYDTTTAHFAILTLFENRLEMLAQEIRDTSSSPSGLSLDNNYDVECIVGRVWDMCDTWKTEMENLLLLAEQFELPLQKLRS